MDVEDTTKVLAKAAAFDRRTVGDTDVLAWHQAIGDLDALDALDAVTDHYRRETRWLMPADVRNHANEAARQRKDREGRRRHAFEQGRSAGYCRRCGRHEANWVHRITIEGPDTA